jgi:hypothetical protein
MSVPTSCTDPSASAFSYEQLVQKLTESLSNGNHLHQPRTNVQLFPFHGLPTENVHHWLKRLEIVREVAGWDDNRTLGMLRLNLLDVASQWFETLDPNDKKDLKKVVAAMTVKFGRDRMFLNNELLNRRQFNVESVAAYSHHVLELCNAINPKMAEEEKIFHLIRGMNEHLATHVLLQQPTSAKECIEEAERKEKVMSFRASPYGSYQTNLHPLPTPFPTSVLPPTAAFIAPSSDMMVNAFQPHQKMDVSQEILKQLKDLTVAISGQRRFQSGHRPPRRDDRTPNGEPICNHCEEVGHIARNCPKRMKNRSTDSQPAHPAAPVSSGQGNAKAGSMNASQ